MLLSGQSTDGRRVNYWFYDIDGKITHRLSERDRLSLNIYNGRDHLYVYEDVDNAGFAPGISTKTTSNIGWGSCVEVGITSWDQRCIQSRQLDTTATG